MFLKYFTLLSEHYLMFFLRRFIINWNNLFSSSFDPPYPCFVPSDPLPLSCDKLLPSSSSNPPFLVLSPLSSSLCLVIRFHPSLLLTHLILFCPLWAPPSVFSPPLLITPLSLFFHLLSPPLPVARSNFKYS